ncbi:MAG: preprotein translocase subunit SecY [Candidatus Magasanikbacteria bacterium]|nr:preprotein translocase subunit SecY [Candidatus Magasanikbacteria bacterium]MCA9391027.1 preprotein translocase subunit SecY [Candidatus Magasanikbacteria bacterium]USN52609.1 MAG: preprotein translocase subunit SecY [Candidatus Nomurabacteria bacterium]
MWNTLTQAWRVKEVRNGLLFVIAMMVIFRVAANIPLPGIDLIALRRFFEANQLLGLLNVFSGGTMSNFSIVALGVGPYITSSIVFQLLTMIVPRLEEIQKEGEAGQKRISQWTRLLTVPLAIVQSFALLSIMRNSSFPILTTQEPLYIVMLIACVTAGTMFLTWLGELITERKVGNGISLLIFAGIVSGLPSTVSRFFATYDSSQWLTVVLYAASAIAMVAGIVFVNEGQRNVPVQYARQSRSLSGTGSGGITSSLPLRVNMTGVIPIIFAVSMLLFPSVLAQFFAQARTPAVANAANWLLVTLQNQTIYGVLYFLFVVGFTYFYATIVFQPERVSENLQKQGGFIPGIRPGAQTAAYLLQVVERITLGGALFLGFIAVTPLIAQALTGSTTVNIGGTSLLIVVSVVIESIKQIEAQITMRSYDVY